MVRRGDSKGRLKEYGKTTGSRRSGPLRARAIGALERLPIATGSCSRRPRVGGSTSTTGATGRGRRRWRPAGIRHRRIYDLRHTYASWSLAAGVDIFTLTRRIGTSVKMIDQTYGHLITGADVHERDLLDAFAATHGESFGHVVDAESETDAA